MWEAYWRQQWQMVLNMMGSPILWGRTLIGAAMPKQLWLHLKDAVAAVGVTSEEGDIPPLPLDKGTGPLMGLLESALAICWCRLEGLYVRTHRPKQRIGSGGGGPLLVLPFTSSALPMFSLHLKELTRAGETCHQAAPHWLLQALGPSIGQALAVSPYGQLFKCLLAHLQHQQPVLRAYHECWAA